MSKASRVRTLAFVAVAVVAMSAAPLSAAQAVPESPSIENLDDSAPGVLTFDVVSGGPYVLATLTSFQDEARPLQAKSVASGRATFTFDTWGVSPLHALAQVITCPSAKYSASDCSSPTSVTFSPLNPAPAVSWSTDTTVGPGQPFSVEVTNPNGGGYFWVQIDTTRVLLANGPNDLSSYLESSYENPTHTVTLMRCTAGYYADCNDTFDGGVKLQRQVDRYVDTQFSVDAPDPTLTQQVVRVPSTLHTYLRGAYTLTWSYIGNNGQTIPVGGPVTGTVPADGDIRGLLAFDRTGLEDGSWDLAVTFSVDDPRFSATPLEATSMYAGFDVETQGPPINVTADRDVIYPTADTSEEPGSLTAHADGDTGYIIDWDVLDAGRRVVRTFPGHTAQIVWNGRDDAGNVVPSGDYTIRVRDRFGNVTNDARSAKVSVVSDNLDALVTRTVTLRVPAARSVVARQVARCSTLRTPAARRGWAGSVGLYANTRCSNTAPGASLVSSVHQVVLPAAARYSSIQVTAYGGATPNRPRSNALLRYLAADGRPITSTALARGLGRHSGPLVKASNAQWRTGSALRWTVSTRARNRYDIKYFLVTVVYQVPR
ncbi:MAG: hypothetical protein JWP74_4191 [Marmoricola sp.]|nr:hypothetical protein [Marmoricola sp.]